MPTIPPGVKPIDLSEQVRAAQLAAEQREEIAARARRTWQMLQSMRTRNNGAVQAGGKDIVPAGAGSYPVTPALGERDFGPGLPLKPRYGPDSPEVQGGPRIYQYPVSSNIITSPRREDARLTPFEQLANLVDLYDVAQIAIATRIEQVQGMDHQIVAKNKREQAARQDECDEVLDFFRKPDGITDFGSWIAASIRDHFVFDAVTFFPRPDKSGDLHSLEVIHGPTIKPLLDDRGRTMAYQQILWGYPFSDFQRNIMRPDGEYDEFPTFSPQDLMYKPRYTRSWTPYGSPPSEWIILRVNQALRKQYSDLAWFTDGNIPEMLVTLSDPSGRMTPEQVEAFERWFNAVMTGDETERRKMRFVPYGTDIKELRPFSYTTELDLWMLQITCAAFSVPPQELGFTQDVNRATAELQEAVNERRGLKPLTKWYKDIFDDIIQRRLGVGWRNRKRNATISRRAAPTKRLQYAFEGLAWQWSFGDKTDQQTVANTYQAYITSEVLSPDEVRAMVFSDQVEGPSPATRKAQAEEAKAAEEARAAAAPPPPGPGGAGAGAEEEPEAETGEEAAAPAGGPPEAAAEEEAGAEEELAVSEAGAEEPGVEERAVARATPRRPSFLPKLPTPPRRTTEEVELDLGSNLRQLARQKIAKDASKRRQFFDPTTLSDILFGQLYRDVALVSAAESALYVTKREGWNYDHERQEAEVVGWLKKHADASAREIISHLAHLDYGRDLIADPSGPITAMLDDYARREVMWAVNFPIFRAVYAANVMKGVADVWGNAAVVPPLHKHCRCRGRIRRIKWQGDEEALNDAGDQQIFYAARAAMRKADDPNHVYIGVWWTREDEKVCKKPFRTPFGTVMGCKALHDKCVTKGPLLGKQAPPTD